MFNYFTNTKNLHNLLWVYSPFADRGNRSAYYPGDSYVDIVVLDAYADEPVRPMSRSPTERCVILSTQATMPGYDEMLAFNKPFALGEIGPTTTNGSFDYMRW